jgi:arylsulfatase
MTRFAQRVSLAALAAGLVATPGWAQPTASPPAPAPRQAAAPQPSQQQRPNVLVWMIDDLGFAQLGCFGGLIATPNIDRVAQMGLRYTNYHTAPICSSSRAAFLTGRNTHSVHMGGHAAVARPFPGYDGKVPADDGTIAANLHEAGYETFALGKWDHMPTEEMTPAGPFTHWPAGQGFDHFYGFLAADQDNWHPTLIRDETPVATPEAPGYHLNHDLADQAIAMIASRDADGAKRPFFMYWATGTAHAPHHAPKEWIARYKGKFDMGWDKAREMILAREKAQGLVPANADLAPRPDGMPPWDSLSPDQKRLYARQMEVFAAAVSYADDQFGRILDALQARGELDNTIVIIASDNGASAEGAYNGAFNEAALATSKPATLAENLKFYDKWGGPETYPTYAMGWAVAGDTPFRYYKQTAHEGGIHVPLVVAWPKGIAAHGELRSQFVHVSDVAPTILVAAGVPLAKVVNDVPQAPMEGLSFAYSFTAPKAATRHQAQYFEMFGNKSLWSDGWTIATTHRLKTWEMTGGKPIDEPWELYDLHTDIGQAHDLAAKYPQRVAALARLFDEQAKRYQVYPLGNIGDGVKYSFQKAAEEFRRRGGKWRYGGPVSNIPVQVGPPILYRSFAMTAKLDLPEAAVTGPVFAEGGQMGGIGLYLRDGKPVFILNTVAGETTEVASEQALPAGASTIRLDFANRAAAPGTPAEDEVTITADGKVLARKTISAAIPVSYGISETFGVGADTGSPVLAGYRAGLPFAGTIGDVVFDFNQPR